MSGLGEKPWTLKQWTRYRKKLGKAGYYVEHCSHCDRSNRHPSCRIMPIPGRTQRSIQGLWNEHA